MCAVALSLGVLADASAWAGRPLTTEDTGTLDPGEAELELAFDYARGGGADVFRLPAGPALNFGLLPRLEGTVAATFLVNAPDDAPLHAGFGDTAIKLKYRMLDETTMRRRSWPQSRRGCRPVTMTAAWVNAVWTSRRSPSRARRWAWRP